MDVTATPTDQKPPLVNGNGHIPTASATNGTSNTASPPKSPAPRVDTAVTPAPTEEAPPATDHTPSEQVSPAPPPASASETPAGNVTDENANVPNEPASTPVSELPVGSLGGPNDDKMQLDGLNEVSSTAPLKADLPHHPSTESATPSLPPLQTDHEMKDAPQNAPPSPSKVSREREPDHAEEPAAKRTKVDEENGAPVDLKLPGLPTPTTDTSGPNAVAGQSAITKMQHKFLMKCVTSLKRMHDSRFYREPVDPIKLNIPNYLHVITRPMDLGTIERKLKANEYPSAQALSDDFALMVQNSLTFNGPDHLVAQEGQKLKATFDKQMINLPKPDEVEEKKPKKQAEKTSAARREPRTSIGSSQPAKAASPKSASTSTTFALGPEGLPTIRRDSFNPDGRPKRSIHPPKRDLPYSTKPKKKKYQWQLRFCQEVLDEIHKPKHALVASAFYYPVDPVALNIPTYHSVIKKPMDLSTVQSKLKTGQYENAEEFASDIRLMLKNCFKFNLKGDPTYAAGEGLQDLFENKWKELEQYVNKHEPHQEQHTDSSEDESEEDADDSDAEDNEKLSLLQKQIAEMSRQVEAIQRKKKTPPTSKKAAKSKSGKKDKKSGGGKKDKKSGGSSGKPSKKRERYVTYHEKQIISNGISSLPDKKMHEALGIIQSNVPALKVCPNISFCFFLLRGPYTNLHSLP